MCVSTQQASPWTQVTTLSLRRDKSLLTGKLSERVTVTHLARHYFLCWWLLRLVRCEALCGPFSSFLCKSNHFWILARVQTFQANIIFLPHPAFGYKYSAYLFLIHLVLLGHLKKKSFFLIFPPVAAI